MTEDGGGALTAKAHGWRNFLGRQSGVFLVLFLRQNVVVVTQLCTIVKIHQNFHLKLVTFIACKLYHYRTGKKISFHKKEIKNFLPKVNVIYNCNINIWKHN